LSFINAASHINDFGEHNALTKAISFRGSVVSPDGA
jgi:hypothetical protein